jgi:hypothetical protein
MIDLIMIGWLFAGALSRNVLVLAVAVEYAVFGVVSNGLADVWYYAAACVTGWCLVVLAKRDVSNPYSRVVAVTSAGGVLLNVTGLALYSLGSGPAWYNGLFVLWYFVALLWVSVNVLFGQPVGAPNSAAHRGAHGAANRAPVSRTSRR